MDAEDKKNTDEIIQSLKGSAVSCSKGYRCCDRNCMDLCKAARLSGSHLLCLEEKPMECEFASCIGGSQFVCFCPLRIYINRKLGK